MNELTAKEIENSKKIIDALMKYFWDKVETKMADGKSFEVATAEVQEEFYQECLND